MPVRTGEARTQIMAAAVSDLATTTIATMRGMMRAMEKQEVAGEGGSEATAEATTTGTEMRMATRMMMAIAKVMTIATEAVRGMTTVMTTTPAVGTENRAEEIEG
jgi:hypothetical protein